MAWRGRGKRGGILSVSAPPLLCGKKGGGIEWRKSEGRKKRRRRRETAEGFQSINGERKEGLPRGGLHTHKFPLPPRFSVFGRGRRKVVYFWTAKARATIPSICCKKKKKGKRKDAGKCFVFCTFFAAPSVLWPYLVCVSPLLFCKCSQRRGTLGGESKFAGKRGG